MKKNVFLVLLVLSAALFLRLINLGSLPHGLQNDEASFFYNAVSLLQTGVDEDGRRMPLYLNSFIDPKPALFSYLQIPFIAVLGKTIFAARFVSALLGTASLFLLYLLIRKLSSNPTLALLVLSLMAISPWHIVLSRSTQEVILSFFFLVLSLLFASKLFLSKNTLSRQWLFFVLTCGGSFLSMYSYHSAKLLLPLFTLGLALYSVRGASKKLIWPVATLVLQASFVIVTMFLVSGGLSRAAAVGLFSTGDTQLVLDEQIRIATATSNPLVIRIFHNKVINYGFAFSQTYFSHFTAQFLFLRGGDPTRYIVPFHGLLYLVELPLLALGIFAALRASGKKRNTALLFLSWLLVSPIPSALTTEESVSMIRTAPMLVPLLYFVAEGILFLWHEISQKSTKVALRITLIVLYTASFAYFVHQYSVFQPRYRPWTRQFIDQQLATYLTQNNDQFSQVVISKVTGQPYVYLALNDLISSSQLQDSIPARLQNEYVLGKYRFVSDGCYVGSEPEVLYVVGGTCTFTSDTPPFREIGEITYFDGAEGYRLLVSATRLEPAE
ncbi:MAG: phospholipid carrier-dependent glycosyltransferase [Candidatus Pacebacteria bacterium]|nr:phospholipid carrier-dependent glycosyltransferase [Candidatus Paceibacterota bacterium]PIR61294.1 MAG: hypothetical protein COU68_00170 [Candidatus Pacebacteria bacterium CG10_big_fil_rev_8_21_14_0_10_45_6]